MKIWKLEADANCYNNFTLVDEQDWDIFIDNNAFNGTSMLGKWKSVQIKLLEEIQKGDMQALFGGIPVFNTKAIRVLSDLLDGQVELLKLDYDLDEYFAVNVLQILDCIDYQHAVPVKFDDGTIWRYERYAFRLGEIKDRHMFKNIDESKGFPLVSDVFRDRVLQHNLKGFLFTELWDSDNN